MTMPTIVRQLSPLFPNSRKDSPGSKAAGVLDRDFLMVVMFSVIGLLLGLSLAFLVPLPKALSALL